MTKLIFFLLSLSLTVFAKTTNLEKTKAHVSFNTTASPGGVRILGETDNSKTEKPIKGTYELNPTDVSGKLELNLKHLDTGIDLRNKHMHEKYLETEKFPSAVLELSPSKYTPGTESSFTGTMNLHGQKKPVTGTLLVKNGTLKLDFFVKLSDYNIEVPKFMGITMKEDIHVLAEATEVP